MRVLVKLLMFTLTSIFLLLGCQIKTYQTVYMSVADQTSYVNSVDEDQLIIQEAKIRLEKERRLQIALRVEEKKRLEEQRKQEEQKKLEEQKKIEEQKKLDEKKKLEEQKKAEEQKNVTGNNSVQGNTESSETNKPVITQTEIMDEIINSQMTLEEKIKKYLGSNTSMVGLVYFDINTGEKIAINENKVFLAASTVKVQMNMIAYDWIKQGKLSLEEKIAYNEAYYEGGTGILQGKDKSKPIPVKTLLDYSIIYSDNIATNMILRRLGGSKSVRAAANLLAGTEVDTSKNNVTAEKEFRILKKLYEGREDEHYSHLIEVMKKTVFHDRLDKYIPKDICAHKIGNYGGYVNDVGIIFTEKPYILVIYTNGLAGSTEKIAQLSRLIYIEQLKK